MTTINTERMAAELDGEYVVYVNGMRLNRLRALPKYLRAGLAARKMFRRLEADPDSGFLGYIPAYMGVRTGAAIQYWRSLADIRRFAQDPDDLHVPAWQWYNDEVGDGGDLGFWAELYVLEAGTFETFYRNMPPVGLGEHGRLVPMADHRRQLGLSETGTPLQEGEPTGDSRHSGDRS